MKSGTAGAIVALLVLFKLYQIGSAPQATPAPIADVQTESALGTGDARTSWAIDLAQRLGNAAPDAATIGFIVAWTQAEDRSDEALGRFNPLNTTEPAGSIGVVNGDRVRIYPTYEDGMNATLLTLASDHPGYAEIVAGIQTNDPERALRGIAASPWGTAAATTEVIWRSESLAPAPAVSASACPVDPCWQSGSGYTSGHPGIDLGATLGQPVYATMDGRAHTSESWPCGNGLSITNGDTMTLMCHLSAFTVADGAEVHAGDQVAQAGSTGDSTGPHVHFEIRQNGANIDPSRVLSH